MFTAEFPEGRIHYHQAQMLAEASVQLILERMFVFGLHTWRVRRVFLPFSQLVL